jgi:hypothetical protein
VVTSVDGCTLVDSQQKNQFFVTHVCCCLSFLDFDLDLSLVLWFWFYRSHLFTDFRFSKVFISCSSACRLDSFWLGCFL